VTAGSFSSRSRPRYRSRTTWCTATARSLFACGLAAIFSLSFQAASFAGSEHPSAHESSPADRSNQFQVVLGQPTQLNSPAITVQTVSIVLADMANPGPIALGEAAIDCLTCGGMDPSTIVVRRLPSGDEAHPNLVYIEWAGAPAGAAGNTDDSVFRVVREDRPDVVVARGTISPRQANGAEAPIFETTNHVRYERGLLTIVESRKVYDHSLGRPPEKRVLAIGTTEITRTFEVGERLVALVSTVLEQKTHDSDLAEKYRSDGAWNTTFENDPAELMARYGLQPAWEASERQFLLPTEVSERLFPRFGTKIEDPSRPTVDLAHALGSPGGGTVPPADTGTDGGPGSVPRAEALKLLRPYDLFVNPVAHRGQVVALVLTDVSGMSRQLGMASIRFERMLAPSSALYAITPGGPRGDDLNQESLGALVVSLPGPPARVDRIVGPVSFDSNWKVLVEGTTTLINAFGAETSAPKIRFLGFVPGGEAEPYQTVDQRRASEGTFSRTPRMFAFDLLKNAFAHQGKQVILDATSFPVLVNGAAREFREGALDGGDYVGVRFNRILAEDQALYDITKPTSGPGGPDVLGQLLVISSGIAKRHMTHYSPLSLRHRWRVEPLGVREGTNRFGATISVPAVKYLGEAEPYR
jgi:hypothetical protein